MARFQSVFGFLAGIVTTGTIALSQNVFAAPVLTPVKIQQTAQPVTVQLRGNDRTGSRYGSGVLIAKQGNTYAVLTNRHVVCALNTQGQCGTMRFQIRTSDNTLHPVMNVYTFEQPNGIPDVAIVLFQTPINYPIATFGDSSQLAKLDAVWINGYPGRNDIAPGKEPLAFHRGFFAAQMPDVHSEGYSLNFGMVAAPGMSGSPIFDASGRVIAIFGQSGSAGILAGIPTNTILELVKRSPNLNRLNLQVDRSDLVGTRPQFGSPQTADDYYLRGVMQLRANPQAALKDFDQAIVLDSSLMLAYRGRAELRAQQGDHIGALRDFESVLKLNPDRTDALDARARVRLQWNDFAGAIADLTEAIQLDPQAATLLFNRATTYSRSGKFANAIADFTQGIILQPKDAVAYRERGRSYLQLNQLPNALRDLNRSIELDPRSSIAWDLRGFIKLGMEDYRGAVADCTVAIQLDPTNAIAYADRGFAWLGLNNPQQTLNDTAQAIRLNPKLGESYTIRAIALERIGDFPRAIAAYETVLGLLKENGQTNSRAYQGITATIAQLREKAKSR